MNISEIIEVVIGVLFVFIVFSIAVMQIQEWVAGILSLRAKNLEKSIRRMLAETNQKDGDGIFEKLYDNQLIKGMSKRGFIGIRKPSYIPDKTFSKAMFDIFVTAGKENSLIKNTIKALEELRKNLPVELTNLITATDLDPLLELAEEIAEGKETPNKLDEGIKKLKPENPDVEKLLRTHIQSNIEYFQQNEKAEDYLKEGIAKIVTGNEQLNNLMNSFMYDAEVFLKHGENALVAFRTELETWFNSTMDRSSGWYKRNAQIISIIIGLVLAILVNVDTLNIANTLWREPTLRQVIVAEAKSLTAEEFPQDEETDQPDSPEVMVEELQEKLTDLDFPVGWNYLPLEDKQVCSLKYISGDKYIWGVPHNGNCLVPKDSPEDPVGLISKILGWLVTAVAASFGASFWFDLLKKIMNVRTSGAIPESTDQIK
jgi:hypothetical protein